MQGHWANAAPYYRCRFPNEYALANRVQHPLNVTLRQDAVLDPLDTLLASKFGPDTCPPPLTSWPPQRPIRKCPRSELNHLPTLVCCPPTFSLAVGHDRAGRPVDPADHYRMRRHAGADCRDCFLPAYASAGGVARAAGVGRRADAAVGGRDDRRGVDHVAGRVQVRQARRDAAVG